MKLLFIFFSVVVASFSSPIVKGAPIRTCSEQSGCFDFTQEDVTATSSCGGGASCVVKVCFQYTNKPGCIKAGAAISHMCDSGDANSCLRTSGPLFDGSGSGTCALDESTEIDKCNEAASGTQFCQEAAAGETVYFIVKDGKATNADTYEELGDGVDDPVIKCDVAQTAGLGNCGNVGAQLDKEMVWSYKIPTNSCNSYCPAGYTLTTVGFDESKDGLTNYQHGDYVSDLGYGFTLGVKPAAGGKDVNIPRIYDSDMSGGADPDLELGLGNLLIIQEDVMPDTPDDNAAGGATFFYFSTPTKIKSIGLVDTEVKTRLSFFKSSGPVERIRVAPIPDSSSIVVEVDQEDVNKLKIAAGSSYGVSSIEFCVQNDYER